MLPKHVLLDGVNEPPPASIPLRAGPLTLLYENGDLRYIRLGQQEILRRVYVAVRDHNWGTVLPVFANVKVDSGEQTFHIAYDVSNGQGDIDFFWQGTISGEADGTIIMTMDGVARSTFQRNRIGFCILHPMTCAGQPVRIEHTGGSIEESAFPTYIAPQLIVDGTVKPMSSFAEMRGIAHEVLPGLWAHLRFQGDVFETEDQRNWTDASFKTYSTPLRLPFPVEVTKGTRIRQSLTLTLAGGVPQPDKNDSDEDLTFAIMPGAGEPLPRIGLGIASHDQPLSPGEIERLQALHLSHLRVELHLAEPDCDVKLRRAAAAAGAIGATLAAALFLSDAAEVELAAFLNDLDEIKPPVHVWMIFHEGEKGTSQTWMQLARKSLASYDPAISIGSGTNAFFAELNRQRPPLAEIDFVCYSLNPQVHAFDNLSLVETLPAQAATVKSARQFIGDKPLAITPVTLKMRFNPNATGPEPEPAAGEMPPQVDVRQMSLFGAGWTLGSLKYLAGSDVQSLTYYETTGWRGVMETEAGSPLPDRFPSLPGSVFPMYHVFAAVSEFAGGRVVPSRSSNNLKVEGMALRKAGHTRLLLANLSPETQQVVIQGLAEQVTVAVLDETNVIEAMTAPETFRQQPGQVAPAPGGLLALNLAPYAFARVDY